MCMGSRLLLQNPGAGQVRDRGATGYIHYPGTDGSSELPQPNLKAMRAEAWHSLVGGWRFSSKTWKLHSPRLRPETGKQPAKASKGCTARSAAKTAGPDEPQKPPGYLQERRWDGLQP